MFGEFFSGQFGEFFSPCMWYLPVVSAWGSVWGIFFVLFFWGFFFILFFSLEAIISCILYGICRVWKLLSCISHGICRILEPLVLVVFVVLAVGLPNKSNIDFKMYVLVCIHVCNSVQVLL